MCILLEYPSIEDYPVYEPAHLVHELTVETCETGIFDSVENLGNGVVTLVNY